MPKQDIIVCAVDGSDASKTAAKWAANTAVKRGIPLRLVSSYSMPQFLYAEGMVPPQELYEDLEAETLEKIEEAKKVAVDFVPDVDVSHQIEEGSPIDMLLDLSEQCTMIVMGSRGLGGLSGMVMGSVSAAVVSHASCPVVVVREDNHVTEETKYGPVVVGVDGSGVSQKAIENAFKEADARGAELIAVHTWMDMQVQASLAGLSAAQQQWQVVEEEQNALLGHRLAGWQERFPDVKVTKVVTRDRPVRALADASEGAQLLVVGSHGRGGFKGMLLGSTSRALLQAAPCPMMVVRPDELPK
ncbi:universal stress protein [Corynebacterium xerosis]|mgnify:FL=1|jgi:nucleotide-binding universal stress UspA family protein|uniref:Universal stress protein n=1 Tax=Corynebacterium xerosis TaxID=1725 RepID=A0A0M2XQH8_9CORY|nr:universal stress protein [Corynebacterium xerosis]SQB96146.1 universal stress protein domain-containing protein, UspA family [Clostridium paraputrificum]AYJ33459.1 universal stress protein [Corynebacterium xerosis]KKO82637.1 universal stress protein [Corynebacterium xerosis]NMF10153.1 universal stress protein [Corynebacterium xerosis]QGS34433.1 universal stress protein [Corynebacterium xerosis]